MTGTDIACIAIVGGVAIIGAVIAVAREAVRRNWVAFTVSLSVTKPDARWPKFPAPKAQSQPEPASPLGAGLPVTDGASPAGPSPAPAGQAAAATAATPLSVSRMEAEARYREYATRRDAGLSDDAAAAKLGLAARSQRRYENRYQAGQRAAGNGAGLAGTS